VAAPDSLLVGLGRAIRDGRDALGLSQEAVSHASGVHRNYIGGIERAERQPTITALARIAAALGLGLGELLARAEGQSRVSNMVRSGGQEKRPGSADTLRGRTQEVAPMPAVEASRPATGNRVAEARKRVGLTQPELAQRAGVGRSTIARIEAGRQSPAIEVAIALSRELGESVEALFGGER